MTESHILAPGEIVTKPGVYTVDIDRYHGAITDGPGISSSGLRKIDSRSPAHYWAESYLNPERIAPERKDAWDIGKAAHVLLLGEAGFRQQFAIRPERYSDWRTNAAKEWRDERRAAGMTVLLPEDVETIRGVAASLAREPLIKAGLLQGEIERSLIWKDEKTGVWLKSRPDVLPTSDGVVVDLKTTVDASPDKIQRGVADYGYSMQGALVGMGLKAVLNVDMTEFVLVWIEKAPPYAVNISPVDPEWIGFGRLQVRRAIDTFARCIEKNEWPAYQSELTTSMPKWLRDRFEAEIKYGLLKEEEVA